jgi:hypothetical protein
MFYFLIKTSSSLFLSPMEPNTKKQKLEEKVIAPVDLTKDNEDDSSSSTENEEPKAKITCLLCHEEHSDDSDDEHIRCIKCPHDTFIHTTIDDDDAPPGWECLDHHPEDRQWDGLCPKHSRVAQRNRILRFKKDIKPIFAQLLQDPFAKSALGQRLEKTIKDFLDDKE